MGARAWVLTDDVHRRSKNTAPRVEKVSGCDVVVEAVSDWSRSRLLNQVVGHDGIEMAE